MISPHNRLLFASAEKTEPTDLPGVFPQGRLLLGRTFASDAQSSEVDRTDRPTAGDYRLV